MTKSIPVICRKMNAITLTKISCRVTSFFFKVER